MILLARSINRQAVACSTIAAAAIFPRLPVSGKIALGAPPSIKHRASVCQNRYPSPSRRSGPLNRVRPSFSRFSEQSPAENGWCPQNSLAFSMVPVVPASRVCTNDPEGGRQTCRKHYHLYSLQRCLGLQLVAKAAILNARLWARPSVVLLAKYCLTANALPARQLAAQRVRWQTTSDLGIAKTEFEIGAARHIRRVALFCLGKLPNDTGDKPCSRKS